MPRRSRKQIKASATASKRPRFSEKLILSVTPVIVGRGRGDFPNTMRSYHVADMIVFGEDIIHKLQHGLNGIDENTRGLNLCIGPFDDYNTCPCGCYGRMSQTMYQKKLDPLLAKSLSLQARVTHLQSLLTQFNQKVNNGEIVDEDYNDDETF